MSCNVLEDKNYWIGKNYSFFQNRKCEFLPCHKINNIDNFSCLFCFCPLYFNKDCKGNYYILSNGLKSCENCLFPHIKQNYGILMGRVQEFMGEYFKNDTVEVGD